MKKLLLALSAFSFLAVSQAKADDAAPKTDAPKKASKKGKKSKTTKKTDAPAADKK